jgi:HrpA-like RNA helicase
MTFENLFSTLSGLPVATIADDVTISVLSGAVTILSSDTGSGKTLYESSHLADHSDGQVVVLVPRRFLAVNAAETVSELAGCEIGQEVGYAVGSQAGDRSMWSEATKLLFVTNGYALASGLINKATTFVLDEVHETSMDLSIVRALLYRRMANGESIKVLEMSATMNIERQAAYWRPVAKTATFETDGKTFDCEVRHAANRRRPTRYSRVSSGSR